MELLTFNLQVVGSSPSGRTIFNINVEGQIMSKKKAEQLGMPIGTASNRLRKSIIFHLIKEFGKNTCYQCGEVIDSEKELSIEHKVPYLDSPDPVGLFFDMNNIGFSHLGCNSSASRKDSEKTHGTYAVYRNGGCDCDECLKADRQRIRKQEERKAFKAHVEVATGS